jgi:Ulp1 family protease
VNGRNHIVTFSQQDRDNLNPGTYVNDNIMDFWMLRVIRNELENTTNIQIFTSHFYSKLVEEGVDCVSQWIENRHIDLWSKKSVIFPINLQSHWSLCVAVNLNIFSHYIETQAYNMDSELTFVLLLDSLGLHDQNVIGTNIWNLLLHEWRKSNHDHDTTKKIPSIIVSPKGIVLLHTMRHFTLIFFNKI